MSANNIKIFTVLLLIITVGGGCKDILAPKKSPSANNDAVRRLTHLDPPSNAKKVMDVARAFARGKKSAKELGDEFYKLSDPQIKQLAEKFDGENNFLHLLTKGMTTSKVIGIAEKFFNKIHPTVLAKQLSASSGGKTAFMNLRDLTSRNPSELAADRTKLLAQLVVANPSLVNQLKNKASGSFDGAEWGAIADVIDATKMSGIAGVIQDDNIKAWLTWATLDPDIAEIERRLNTNFRKLYVHAGSYKQALMRNFLLEKAYDDDVALIAAGAQPLWLTRFIEEMGKLGLENGLGDDVYQLLKNPAAAGSHSGSLLYVLTKRVGQDLAGRLDYSEFSHLKAVSKIIKEKLGNAYVNHVNSETFGFPAPETILASLQALPLSQGAAKSVLNLALSPDDIYQELKDLATKANVADRKVSHLKSLLEDFKRDNADLDAIVDITVPAVDNGAGAGSLQTGDKFIHVVAQLKTDNEMLDLLQYLTAHISERAIVLGEDNPAAGLSALAILTGARAPQLIGAKQGEIIEFFLSEALIHGNGADLAKAFHDMDLLGLPLLGSFVYENRAYAIQGGGTMANLFVAEYGLRAPASAKELAKVLIEAALKADGIGNANTGLVAIISQNFLPLLALQDTGYKLFGKGALVGNNNTLLYDILIHVAAIKMQMANLDNDQALRALNTKIRGGIGVNNRIRIALGSFAAGNVAIAAFPGALHQAEVSALAQAFKAIFPAAPAWSNLCRNHQNASSANRMVWQLLRFTIAAGGVNVENDARAAHYLDY